MSEAATLVIVGILALALVAVVVTLVIIIYHQMLLTNEVNKRLNVLVNESIDKERQTIDEYNALLQEYSSTVQEKTAETVAVPAANTSAEEQEEAFNPHAYNPNDYT